MINAISDFYRPDLPRQILHAQARAPKLMLENGVPSQMLTFVAYLVSITNLKSNGRLLYSRSKAARICQVTDRTLDRYLGQLEALGVVARRIRKRSPQGTFFGTAATWCERWWNDLFISPTRESIARALDFARPLPKSSDVRTFASDGVTTDMQLDLSSRASGSDLQHPPLHQVRHEHSLSQGTDNAIGLHVKSSDVRTFSGKDGCKSVHADCSEPNSLDDTSVSDSIDGKVRTSELLNQHAIETPLVDYDPGACTAEIHAPLTDASKLTFSTSRGVSTSVLLESTPLPADSPQDTHNSASLVHATFESDNTGCIKQRLSLSITPGNERSQIAKANDFSETPKPSKPNRIYLPADLAQLLNPLKLSTKSVRMLMWAAKKTDFDGSKTRLQDAVNHAMDRIRSLGLLGDQAGKYLFKCLFANEDYKAKRAMKSEQSEQEVNAKLANAFRNSLPENTRVERAGRVCIKNGYAVFIEGKAGEGMRPLSLDQMAVMAKRCELVVA